MNKNVKVIGTKEAGVRNNVTVRIAVRDYFPDYNSGIEYFDVGLEAYNDLCQYKALMTSLVSENDEDAVKIDVKKFYPHLCNKKTTVFITKEMLESQIDHINCRKRVLIRLKDLQKNYRDCPDFMEVSNEICMTLARYRNEDNCEEERLKKKTDGKGFEEEARGEINGMYQEDNTKKIDLLITVENLFKPYGEILTRRAIMYLCYDQTPTKIARHEGISVCGAWKSIDRIKEIVKSAGKEYFGI